jgi:steroid 5-alpha reductase family enzyme
VVAKFNGSFVVFLSAFQSYAIAKHAGLSILDASFATCAANAALCWLLSIATGDYSWVDRLWSVVPAFYAFHFAAAAHWGDDRTNLMAVLATLWGLRLSYNFARKDGYQVRGESHNRWASLLTRARALVARVLHRNRWASRTIAGQSCSAACARTQPSITT